MTVNLTNEYCIEHGYDIVSYPFNRIFKLIGIICSLTSIPFLIHFQRCFLNGNIFHFNIKIILICFFADATFHATIMTYYLSVMTTLSFTSVDKACEIFMSREFYIVGHLLNFYALLTQTHLQLAACIERVLATVWARQYERKGRNIGLSLVVAALMSPVPACVFCYWNETFAEPMISVMTTPANAAIRVNIMFGYGIVVCVFGIICLHITNRVNKSRRLTSCSLRFHLSSHFQAKENICTTMFIRNIMSLQIIIYLIFGIGTLTMRLLKDVFTNIPLYLTIKTSLFLLPVYFICLPLLSMRLLRQIRDETKEKAQKLVNMKSTGNEGRENYELITYADW